MPKETARAHRSFSTDTCKFLGLLTLLDPFLVWVTSATSVSLCDLSSGGLLLTKGDGSSVWHPDCRVSFWAEASPTDKGASQPCPRTPQDRPLVDCHRGAELCQLSLPNCLVADKIGRGLLPCKDLGRMEVFCLDLESRVWDRHRAPSQHLKLDLPSLAPSCHPRACCYERTGPRWRPGAKGTTGGMALVATLGPCQLAHYLPDQ